MPVLSGLHSLEQLKLVLNVGQGTDAWSTACTVSAALSPLLLSRPTWPRVRIWWEYRNQHSPTAAEREQQAVLGQALEEGVRSLQHALHGMGRDQRAVALGKRTLDGDG